VSDSKTVQYGSKGDWLTPPVFAALGLVEQRAPLSADYERARIERGLRIWLEERGAFLVPRGRNICCEPVRWSGDYRYQNVELPRSVGYTEALALLVLGVTELLEEEAEVQARAAAAGVTDGE